MHHSDHAPLGTTPAAASPDGEPADFARRVREARTQRGVTQADLGKVVGLSQQTIAKIEKGRIERPKFAPEIAAALGISTPLAFDPTTWFSLPAPSCEVARIAREMQRLSDAHGVAQDEMARYSESRADADIDRYFAAERLDKALGELIDASRVQATYARASSPLGAQHQVMLAACLVDELWELVPAGNGADQDAARRSTEIKSQVAWLLYSVVAVLEQASGVAREEVGAAYYMTRLQDPHLAVSAAIEVAS